MKKKIVSILLSAVMAMTIIPLTMKAVPISADDPPSINYFSPSGGCSLMLKSYDEPLGDNGADYEYENGVLKLNESVNTIFVTNAFNNTSTTNTIEIISSGANIVLDGVNISNGSRPAINLSNNSTGTVHIYVNGINYLTGSDLAIYNPYGKTVIIESFATISNTEYVKDGILFTNNANNGTDLIGGDETVSKCILYQSSNGVVYNTNPNINWTNLRVNYPLTIPTGNYLNVVQSINNESSITNNGTVTVPASNYFYNDGSFTNDGGTLEANIQNSLDHTIENKNNGTINTRNFIDNLTTQNAGIINNTSGTITFNENITNNGTIINGTGAYMSIGHTDGESFDNSGDFTNSGTFTINETGFFYNKATGNFTNNGQLTINKNLYNFSPTFINNGTIDVNYWLQNTPKNDDIIPNITNNSVININSNSTFDNHSVFDNAGQNASVIINGSFNNYATLNNSNGALITNNKGFYNNYYDSNRYGVINNSGTITNATGSDTKFSNIGGIINNNVGGKINIVAGSFYNYAKREITSTLNNEGEITVSGSFTNKTTVNNKLTFDVLASGTFLNDTTGTFNNEENGIFTNEGTFSNKNDFINNAGATLTNADNTANEGGAGIMNNYKSILNSGTFVNNSTFNNCSDLQNNGGSIENNKDMTNYVGAEIENKDGSFVNNCTLINKVSNDNNVISYATIANNAIFTNNGTLENYGKIQNTRYENQPADVTTVFTNLGTIRNYEDSIIYNAENTSFINGSTEENISASLRNNGSITNDGLFTNIDTLTNDNCYYYTQEGANTPTRVDTPLSIFTNNKEFINKGSFENNTTFVSPTDESSVNNSGNIENNFEFTIGASRLNCVSSLINSGTIVNNSEVRNHGFITNGEDGLINNVGYFYNENHREEIIDPYYHVLYSYSKLTNNGTVLNNVNSNFNNNGEVINNNLFTNKNTVTNNYEFTNSENGRINNFETFVNTDYVYNNGTFYNDGSIDNDYYFYNNQTSSVYYGYGHVTNDGIIDCDNHYHNQNNISCTMDVHCALCAELIPASGHDYYVVDWHWDYVDESWTVAPVLRCSTCGAVQDITEANDSENPVDGEFTITTNTIQPTCLSNGTKIYVARFTFEGVSFSNVYTEIIPALGHNLTHVDAEAPTCEVDGVIEHWECSHCPFMYSDEEGNNVIYDVVIPATGHSYDNAEPSFNWASDYESCDVTFVCDECSVPSTIDATIIKSNTDATCEHGGTRSYKATVWFNGEQYSSEEITVSVDALGHTPGDVHYKWSQDYSMCVATITCETCSEVLVREEAFSVVDSKSVKTATCQRPWTQRYVCTFDDSRLGKVTSNAIEMGPATTHNWSNEYVRTDNTHYHVCSICGQHKDEGEHVYSDSTDYTCNTCGYENPTIGVNGFLNRLYSEVLGRPADANKAQWIERIENNEVNGLDVAMGFFNSPEYLKKNVSDEQFVTDLYRTFLGRNPDGAGKSYWMGRLANGESRTSVIAGIANSNEWATISFGYGMSSGGNGKVTTGITAFVERLYTKCLQRKAESKGANDWVSQLLSDKVTAADVAYGFFFSAELTNKNLSDSEFIARLYQTLFDRNGSATEVNYWLDRIDNGASRTDVFYGFADSAEFKALCASYGIQG